MATASVICLPPISASWQSWLNEPIDEQAITVFRLRVPLDTALLTRWHALLQPAEQERATRFRQAADRHRFILGRGFFRFLGSLLTGQPAQTLSIAHTAEGKPFLRDYPERHFSVSHTGEWVVVAVARRPVGVDVEFANPHITLDDLIATVLSPAEKEAMHRRTDARLFFYECWTRKEALVKATGLGITDNVGILPALEGVHTVSISLIGADGTWFIQPFFVDDAFPAALASVYMKETTLFRFYTVDPSQLLA